MLMKTLSPVSLAGDCTSHRRRASRRSPLRRPPTLPQWILSLSTIAFLFVTPWTASRAIAQECIVSVEWDNRNRYVYGAVNKECTSCSPFTHSPVWGNWGVASMHSNKDDDSTQFKGWQSGPNVGTPDPPYGCDEDINVAKPQWNSCTRDTPQTSEYFNYNNWTEQWSGDRELFASGLIEVSVECPEDVDEDGVMDRGGCIDDRLDPVRLGLTMMIYELDEPDGDDIITRLVFDRLFAASMQCSPYECGPGESDWQSSVADLSYPNVASTEVLMRVNGALFRDPVGACTQSGR